MVKEFKDTTQNRSIAFILGTRPEIIKLSPVIRACIRKNIRFIIIHTGQHYSYELDEIFFKELSLPKPDYNLHVGSCPHGEQTGKMLIGIEQILLKEKPNIVITLGDPNSAFAGTLAAAKLQIPVCHIEAGRRSFARNMPEELNRLMIDQISDILFTPNETTKQNLINEGIGDERIILSGDPIVDAVLENKKIALDTSKITSDFQLTPKQYFLATVHRPENLEDRSKLSNILEAFQKLVDKYNYPLIFSVHPKTRNKFEEYAISTDGLVLTGPLGYLDFLRLEMDAAVLLTDSGSLQEEACILKTPCVTLRDETERPETIIIGSNILAGTNIKDILDAVGIMIQSTKSWENPFGQSGVSDLIIKNLIDIAT